MLKIFHILVYIMVLLSCLTKSFPVPRLSFRARGLRRIECRAGISTIPNKQEYIIGTADCNENVGGFASCRTNLTILASDDNRLDPANVLWAAFRDEIQVDSVVLEEQYLGRKKAAVSETVKSWENTVSVRSDQHECCSIASSGEYGTELAVSIAAVQRAAFVIRSLQWTLLDPAAKHPIKHVLQSTPHSASSNKTDKTPVTVADFAVQALIIDALSAAFPNDLFVAEEDSALVRTDPAICEAVLMILRAASGADWTPEKLYAILDKGNFGTKREDTTGVPPPQITGKRKQRVWVLDPIDGTKGFVRGEHCCTGLGLLVDGVTQLSVLGCPNLNLLRLLQGSSYDDKDITYIDPPISLRRSQAHLGVHSRAPTVFHPHSGSVYFAVTNQGAFARSLSMPLGAAFEVTTSAIADSSKARLCESAEAMFGDREVTARTAASLGVKSEFVRIDGMCKHCVVGVGAAEATLRLPPGPYREKIWDHVAGDHFVREAGGKVTDLRGARLDYSAVKKGGGDGKGDCRELGAEVQGVVISNGVIHSQIVKTINEIRAKLGKQ